MMLGLEQPAPAAPPKSPRARAEERLSEAQAKFLAHQKASRDVCAEQDRRREGLAHAEEVLAAGRQAIRDMASEPVVHVGDKFGVWRSSKAMLAKAADVVKALRQQIARGKQEQGKLESATGLAKAEIALAERDLAQFGRLLTLPVRPRRRRARRNANK